MAEVATLSAWQPVRPQVGQQLYLRVAGDTLHVLARLSNGQEQHVRLRSRDQLFMYTKGLFTELVLAECELVEYFETVVPACLPRIDNCLLGFVVNKGINRRHLAEFVDCTFQVKELA
jgi:hypothetical protein